MTVDIPDLKTYFSRQFHTEDLSTLRYFFGIGVTQSKMDMYLSQRKYVLDLLLETEMLDSRLVDTPMNYYVKLDANMRELFIDVGQYKRLVGKLIYLTVI